MNPTEPRSSRSPSALIIGALIALTFIAFYPALTADFIIFDDPFYVYNNSHINDGLSWASIKWCFTVMHVSNWHPLTWLSHNVDCEVFGLKAAGHHAVNLGLHIANTVILFLLMRRLTGAVWSSVIIAALFGVHPLHVESVAWVSERKDVLSTFFGLLTLCAYAKYVTATSSSKIWYALTFIVFCLGLMSKPMLVTFPFVLLLLDYWPLNRLSPLQQPNRVALLLKLILEKLPFFVLVIISCVLTMQAQSKGGSVAPIQDISLVHRLENGLVGYGWYLLKLFWPVNLAIIYPLMPTPPLEKIISASVVLLAVTGMVLWQFQKRPHLFVGWFWFIGTLVPVIGFVQVGMQAYADRYTYIPYIGLFLIVTWLATELAQKSRGIASFLRFAAAAAIILCVVMTNVQTRKWKDSESVFQNAVNVTENNFLAMNNLGFALAERNEHDAAILQYRAALAIAPQFADALNNLGFAYLQQTNIDLALRAFREAEKANPKSSLIRNNLATALHESGDYTNAIAEYQKIIATQPDYAEAHYNLGNTLSLIDQPTNAIESYQRAIQYRPNYSEAHLNLGYELLKLHRLPEAKAAFQNAQTGKTNSINALLGFAAVAAEENDLDAESANLRAVLELAPSRASTRVRLAEILATQGRTTEATTEAQTAARLRPDFAPAHYMLGNLNSHQGDTAEAIRNYERAIKLKPEYPEALNNLAWILSASRDPQFRNGQRAVELARRACNATGNKSAQLVGTLAAAHAEAGDFANAVASAELAIKLAEADGDAVIVQKNKELIELYQAGKAYHQP